MDLQIRRFNSSDINTVVQLSLLAWEPVFVSWERILGPELFPIAIYSDWRKSQKGEIENICQNEEIMTWVGEVEGKIVGFVAYSLNDDNKTGEVQLLAVSPDYQNQGIGTELNIFALQKMKESGMKLAVAGTGGDDGHTPARTSYKKAGYTALPLVRYYKEL